MERGGSCEKHEWDTIVFAVQTLGHLVPVAHSRIGGFAPSIYTIIALWPETRTNERWGSNGAEQSGDAESEEAKRDNRTSHDTARRRWVWGRDQVTCPISNLALEQFTERAIQANN